MGLIHARGRHRGAAPAELRAAHREDVRTIDALRGTVTDLMTQLDQAGIDFSGALEDLRVARAELAQAEQAVADRDRRIADLEHRLAVGVRDCPKPPPERVTFTLPAVRRSRHVYVVAAGAEKAEAVARAVAGAAPSDWPVAGAVGRESTVFFLDEASASQLG